MSAPYLLNPLNDFVKLISTVPPSETVCRTHDSATLTQGQGYTSMLWDSAAGDLAVLQTDALFKLCSRCQNGTAPVDNMFYIRI